MSKDSYFTKEDIFKLEELVKSKVLQERSDEYFNREAKEIEEMTIIHHSILTDPYTI